MEFTTKVHYYTVTPKILRNIFAGLNYYTNQNDATKKINSLVKEIENQIVSTKLNSFDVDYNLNITPEVIGDILA